MHYTLNFDLFFPGHQRIVFAFEQGGLGVQLFFMISGFVILMSTKRHDGAKDFALARATRLYPTYWVCLTLTIVFVHAFRVSQLYRPVWELPVNYTMLQSFLAVRDFDGVYWSLARELVFYGLIAVALLLFRRVPPVVATWGAFGWSLAGLALIMLHRLAGTSWSGLLVSASVAQYAPLFGLGMILYLFSEHGRLHPLVVPMAVLGVLNEGLVTGWTTALLVGAIIIGFAVVILVGDVPALRWGPLTWFGAISYPLYLLHQNIGYVMMERTVDRVGPWPARAIAVAVAVLLAWAVHELVEKRLTRRVKSALTSVTAPRATPAPQAVAVVEPQ